MIARITGTVTIWCGLAVALILCAWPMAGPVTGSWCGIPIIQAIKPVPAVDVVDQPTHDLDVACQQIGRSHVFAAGGIAVVGIIAGITMLTAGADDRRA